MSPPWLVLLWLSCCVACRSPISTTGRDCGMTVFCCHSLPPGCHLLTLVPTAALTSHLKWWHGEEADPLLDPNATCPPSHPLLPSCLTWSGDRRRGQTFGAEVPRARGSHGSNWVGQSGFCLPGYPGDWGWGFQGEKNFAFKGTPSWKWAGAEGEVCWETASSSGNSSRLEQP